MQTDTTRPGMRLLAATVLGFLLCFLCQPASVQAQVSVDRISFASLGDEGVVLRVHADEPVMAYQQPKADEDGMVQWTLFNTQLSQSFAKDQLHGPLAWYGIEQSNGHLQFRFAVENVEDYTLDAYRDRTTNHVLLRVARTGEVSRIAESEDDGEETDSEPPVSTASLSPRSTMPASGEASDRWRLDTVVIDAGHGGHDPGAIGPGGVRESDVALATALRLGEYIEERMDGVDVVYTRTGDYFVELHERGRIANEAGGKLFISLHANSARNRRAAGSETWILGTHRTEEARRVMEEENSVIQFERDPDRYDDFQERSNSIRQTLAHSTYMRSSEQLASLIQDQFADRVHRTSRGVKQAPFIVLWRASMPAVLVELGFLSNADEARFLNSERGQIYMASAVFRAVREFKDQYEKGLFVQN